MYTLFVLLFVLYFIIYVITYKIHLMMLDGLRLIKYIKHINKTTFECTLNSAFTATITGLYLNDTDGRLQIVLEVLYPDGSIGELIEPFKEFKEIWKIKE